MFFNSHWDSQQGFYYLQFKWNSNFKTSSVIDNRKNGKTPVVYDNGVVPDIMNNFSLDSSTLDGGDHQWSNSNIKTEIILQ